MALAGPPPEDDANEPPLDHLGWRLACAASVWKARFVAAMVEHGFAWFGEARGALIQHIDRRGTLQSELTRRAGISKQAVQQQLDDLVRDGVVARVGDPADTRRNIITLTATGREALAQAEAVKRAIDLDYRRRLGPATAEALDHALAVLGER